jgi:hypothetical protein
MKISKIEKIKTANISIPAVCVEEHDCKSYIPLSGVDEQKRVKNVNVCLYENRMGYSNFEIYPIPPFTKNQVK